MSSPNLDLIAIMNFDVGGVKYMRVTEIKSTFCSLNIIISGVYFF